ncbi:HTH domain-containing protein [Latilactobacillus curvatus]
MTANELADVVAVSQKTIYRSVKSINETYKMTLVESEHGRGYLLNYQNYLQIMKQTHEKDYVAFSPVERRNVIILSCLFNAPFTKSIENLYHKFYVRANYKFNPNKPGIFQWQSVDDVFLMVVD